MTTVLQTRNQATELRHELARATRGSSAGTSSARSSDAWCGNCTPEGRTTGADETRASSIELGFYRLISALGGFTLYDPDKMIDYSKTPQVGALRVHVLGVSARRLGDATCRTTWCFADAHFRAARLPLQPAARVVLRSQGHEFTALVHARRRHHVARPDSCAGRARRRKPGTGSSNAFNDWAHARGGSPLLNQSPFVKKAHVVAAYGDRWTQLCTWIRQQDPNGPHGQCVLQGADGGLGGDQGPVPLISQIPDPRLYAVRHGHAAIVFGRLLEAGEAAHGRRPGTSGCRARRLAGLGVRCRRGTSPGCGIASGGRRSCRTVS